MVLKIRQEELDYRKQLYALGLKTSERLPLPEVNIKRRKVRQAREEEGDYECEICRANLFVSLVRNVLTGVTNSTSEKPWNSSVAFCLTKHLV
jgi:protein Jumonji